jgi:RND superfamily putative drug exporter
VKRGGVTTRLAVWSALHPWVVVGLWLVAVLLGLTGWHYADHTMTLGTKLSDETESSRGNALVGERLGSDPAATRIICAGAGTASAAPGFQPSSDGAPRRQSMPRVVASIADCYEARWATISSGSSTDPWLLPARQTALTEISFSTSPEEAKAALQLLLPPASRAAFPIDKPTATIEANLRAVAQDDLVQADKFGLPLAFIILLVIIRALLTPFVPILIAAAAVVIAAGMAALTGHVYPISFYVINMVVMVGLAVGIDYSLLILERYREERRIGLPLIAAIEASSISAGRTVLASGVTVIVSLAGMLLIPISVFRDLGIGSILVVSVGLLAVITLLPALLRLIGSRIDWPRPPSPVIEQPMGNLSYGRLATLVTRWPLPCIILVSLLIGLLSSEALDLRSGASLSHLAPVLEDSSQPSAEVLGVEVATTLMSVVEIVVDGTQTPQADVGIERLVAALGQDKDFAPVLTLQSNEAGDLKLINALVVRRPDSNEASAAVERLRTTILPRAFNGLPVEVFVSGALASQRDAAKIIEAWQFRVVGIVFGMSFIFLMLVFRSIVVPLLATSMTLVSASAAIGLLVLVMQKGRGAAMLGLAEVPTIEVWVPVVLFCILFGLSMDYHVFLLSRINEYYRGTGDPTAAIARGLQSTGGLIFGAAMIMVVVFGCFAAGRLVMLQQIGFGLAAAIFIDALLVRSILVPASMTLLGHWNWYLPSWLQWLPRITEQHSHATRATVREVAPVPENGVQGRPGLP